MAKTTTPVAPPIRLFDARPDRLDFRDLPYRPPLKSLPPLYPDDQAIARWLPSYARAGLVLDQGSEGACTGFGLACVINFLFWIRHMERQGRRPRKPESVSPRMLYELAKRYDEWAGEDYQGSSCRGALKGWQRHGVCSRSHWPYLSTRGTYAPPRRKWETDALTRTLGVYYRVDRRSVIDMQAAILNIGAIFVSARVHAGWDALLHGRATAAPRSHKDVPDIVPPRPLGPLNGHAFAIVGYDEHGFIVQNSWGRQWGASGFARLSYKDWAAHGTDVWACALGVPATPSASRIAGTRWRVPSASHASPQSGDRPGRAAANPADDPWPIDHEFSEKAYEPISTAEAYAHTLVTGNDGVLCVRDLTKGGSSAQVDQAAEIVCARPLSWARTRPAGPLTLAIYAHGGLNSEDASIRRIRVLAPYFLANGIYPLFLTWRTGPGETIRDIVEDWLRRIPGFQDERAAGVFGWLSDQRDRAIEAIARPLGRGIWSEMRENAERGMLPGHGLDLMVTQLAELRHASVQAGRELNIHLIGHSAGSIMLGHVLEHVMATNQPVGTIASCSLYAAACSVRFANQRYLAAAAQGLLPLDRLWLACLSDENEKRDGLPHAGAAAYGKSLLYLVSRALDDERKIPILGMARALDTTYANDSDQWAASHLAELQRWQAAWHKSPGHQQRSEIVAEPTVRITKAGNQQQSVHGCFDNHINLLTRTLERITGGPLTAPMEWLDY